LKAIEYGKAEMIATAAARFDLLPASHHSSFFFAPSRLRVRFFVPALSAVMHAPLLMD